MIDGAGRAPAHFVVVEYELTLDEAPRGRAARQITPQAPIAGTRILGSVMVAKVPRRRDLEISMGVPLSAA